MKLTPDLKFLTFLFPPYLFINIEKNYELYLIFFLIQKIKRPTHIFLFIKFIFNDFSYLASLDKIPLSIFNLNTLEIIKFFITLLKDLLPLHFTIN